MERVYIARDAGTPVPVFVKFTSPLSALRVSLILKTHFKYPVLLNRRLFLGGKRS